MLTYIYGTARVTSEFEVGYYRGAYFGIPFREVRIIELIDI